MIATVKASAPAATRRVTLEAVPLLTAPPHGGRMATKRKDRASMVNTKDKVYDAAVNVKPYVERAMSDDQLRTDVLSAFNAAKELYSELTGSRRDAVTLATRVATDDEIRDKLKAAVHDPRSAAERP